MAAHPGMGTCGLGGTLVALVADESHRGTHEGHVSEFASRYTLPRLDGGESRMRL